MKKLTEDLEKLVSDYRSCWARLDFAGLRGLHAQRIGDDLLRAAYRMRWMGDFAGYAAAPPRDR